MPRFYVKNKENKWNVYSTIIDNLLYDKWLTFNQLREAVITELVMDKEEELATLLTEKPQLNVMSYEDCMNELEGVDNEEIRDN